MTTYADALNRLYALAPRGVKLGLDRVHEVCEFFGRPERTFEVVHVAGTNGKGTVCAFVASMLQASGKRVGLYTSPHLVNFSERIRVNGNPIEPETMAELLNSVMDAGKELTFFEVATVASFLAFKESAVEYAVLETGLGGRLDATNVVPRPRVVAITRVAYDHMDELGNSLAAIASEKAAIIKPGCAVVTGRLHPDAEQVVQSQIEASNARLVALGSPEPVPGKPLAYPRIAMFGTNLAVATTIARELSLSPDDMSRGIESTSWPGRNELLHRNGRELTLLDCAHNPDGAVTLSHVLDPGLLGEIESRREIALVFGALDRKNWRAMLRRLEQVAGHRVFVAPPIAGQSVDPREMAALLAGEVAENVQQALVRARAMVGPFGVVVVTGSTYLVGAARALLLGLQPDPPIDM